MIIKLKYITAAVWTTLFSPSITMLCAKFVADLILILSLAFVLMSILIKRLS